MATLGSAQPLMRKLQLEEQDIESEIEAEQGLSSVLQAIPQVVGSGLKEGDSGALVTLLQLFLIYTTDNPDRDRLAAAGPTGYYGAITSNAVRAYQEEQNLSESGQYDTSTRGRMMKRAVILNLES